MYCKKTRFVIKSKKETGENPFGKTAIGAKLLSCLSVDETAGLFME